MGLPLLSQPRRIFDILIQMGLVSFFYLFLLCFFIYLIKLTAFIKLNQVNNISLIYFFVFFNEYLDCINIFFNFKKIR
jgi:hypothetical protein